jgi:hypothetical protein
LDCRFFEYSQYAIDNPKCLAIFFDLEDPPEGLCHIYSVQLSFATFTVHNTLRTRNLNLFIDFVFRSVCVCVFITAGPIIKLCAGRGRGTVKDMYYKLRRAEACVD